MSQEELFKTIVEILNNLNIPYMLTGSNASNFYGEPRSTHDIDFVVVMIFDDLQKLEKSFDKQRYYLEEEDIKSAITDKSTFNLIDSYTGLKIDFWILKDDIYHKTCFNRRVKQNILGITTYIATAEDVILTKLNWCKLCGESERQFKDAMGVYEIQKENLDMDYIYKWVEYLAIKDLFERIIKEAEI